MKRSKLNITNNQELKKSFDSTAIKEEPKGVLRQSKPKSDPNPIGISQHSHEELISGLSSLGLEDK